MSSSAEELIRRHRLTVEEYHRMGEAGILRQDERVELIEGEIVDMVPIGSAQGAAVKRLIRIMTQAVGERAIVAAQDPVLLDENSEPQPDIALLRSREDFYANAHPDPKDVLLIIEVADSSLRYDREVKIPLYARHGIPEVWLVDLEHKALTTHRQPQDKGYKEVLKPDSLEDLELPGLEGLRVDLSELF